MFYGGALLSHLTAEDAEVTEFIQLLSINRNLAIVIDSDRRNAGEDLNKTKQRVISEIADSHAVSIVTDGYTIENYVPNQLLNKAIEAHYPNHSYDMPESSFESPLGKTFVGSESKPSKTTIARSVVTNSPSWDEWPQHLKESVRAVVKAIRVANGMATS